MSKRRKFFLWLAAIFAITLIVPCYYLVKQIQENRIVDRYLTEHNLIDLPISKETALAIARQVRADFNVKQETFVALKMDNRPFLREDAGFLLTCKEGLCGEGARVVVRLLTVKGFDATRVTLYDEYMQFAHTLVSVDIGGQRFWLDTINSTDSLTNLLDTVDISQRNFQYLDYSENISERVDKVEMHKGVNETEEFKRNLGKYFLYSFEAIPYTKLLSKVGINKRVFNLDRPPRFISSLAEMPNMIMFWATFMGSVIITLLCIRPLRRFLR